MRSKLSFTAWATRNLHAPKLIRIRPFSEHRYPLSQLLTGQEPDIPHHKTFGCAVYVLIAPPQRTKMGPQKEDGDICWIWFSHNNKVLWANYGWLYLRPGTRIILRPGGEKNNKAGKRMVKEIEWNQPSMSWQDPRTKECEIDVQRLYIYKAS